MSSARFHYAGINPEKNKTWDCRGVWEVRGRLREQGKLRSCLWVKMCHSVQGRHRLLGISSDFCLQKRRLQLTGVGRICLWTSGSGGLSSLILRVNIKLNKANESYKRNCFIGSGKLNWVNFYCMLYWVMQCHSENCVQVPGYPTCSGELPSQS